MKFYVSKCHGDLNGKPYNPEALTDYICVNPKYPVKLTRKDEVKAIIDSGAFQDVKNEHRLSFDDALARQLEFEKKYLEIKAEAIVSYDRLVDEQFSLSEGQIKKRVDEATAAKYVEETIQAAQFLSGKRRKLSGRKLILSCQGVTVNQYLRCIREVLDVAKKTDIIGFGGFCIVSQSREVENQFFEIIQKAFPIIKEAGIKRVHIFGLGQFRTLVQADIYARMNKIELSYDTSSPELNGTMGRMFFAPIPMISTVFTKDQKKKGYHPCDLALFNIKMINRFWEDLEELDLPKEFIPGYEKRVPSKIKNGSFKGMTKLIQTSGPIEVED